MLREGVGQGPRGSAWGIVPGLPGGGDICSGLGGLRRESAVELEERSWQREAGKASRTSELGLLPRPVTQVFLT